ncbi:hypothetical protein EBT25_17545, partial [bacterium]|nr:hypothetical protein [bacterium]
SATPSYEMQHAVMLQRVQMAELHQKYDGGKPAELMFLSIGELKKEVNQQRLLWLLLSLMILLDWLLTD